MTKKTKIGLIIGLVAGIIDITPMIIQKLSWNANVSAFIMWIIVGFLLSCTSLKVKGILKGVVISFLILTPNIFIIGWTVPLSLIPIFIMTLMLGSLSGFVYQKIIKE
jgi:hypothetical protein